MKSLANLRILVIEDDTRMVELLRDGLCEKGHNVLTAASAEEGKLLLDKNNFDAIVLDIGLPGQSGYTIVQMLRQRTDRPAIIMLTALDQEDNIVTGLDAGADDYITKPFSFPELAARIVSAVRRTRITSTNDFSFGPFQLDIKKRRLLCRDTEVHITRSEYLLLRVLVHHRGEMVSRRQLMQAVWGTTAVSHGALDTLVNALRIKLNDELPGLIATSRGVGYSMLEETELNRPDMKTGRSQAS